MRKFNHTVQAYLSDESGAVTVDWVVLTAGVVGLGLATMAVVSAGVEDLSGDMQTQLETQEVSASFGSDLQPYDGAWLAPGAYDADAAWVAQLSDESILGLMEGYEQYSDPDNVDLNTHNEPRYHDQYWMAYNEAISRDLEIPSET